MKAGIRAPSYCSITDQMRARDCRELRLDLLGNRRGMAALRFKMGLVPTCHRNGERGGGVGWALA